MSGAYDDIIDLPHHVSRIRPQMAMADRAAQFSPFAALTGYDAVIRETGRLTDQRIEQEEDVRQLLDRKLWWLEEHLEEHPAVTFYCFRPDARKAGGAYLEVTGIVKKLDRCARVLVLQDGTRLPLDEILQMEGEIFSPPADRT